MGKPHLLVVEDEKAHRLIIHKSLQDLYDITMAVSFEEGLKAMHTGEFDALLLDIMLGDGNGFDLLTEAKKIDQLKHKPVIFLTGRTEVSSKVLGFNLGADDYIVKPCDPEELRVRIVSKLKKFDEIAGRSVNVVVGHFTFNVEMQVVEAKKTDGSLDALDLTPLEFKLFYYLANKRDQTHSREDILQAVWGDATNVLDRSVDTYVASLRRKLGAHSKVIKSVHGVGYRFTLEGQHSHTESA